MKISVSRDSRSTPGNCRSLKQLRSEKIDEDLLTSNFCEKTSSSKSESCERAPSPLTDGSSPGKHDVSSISRGVSKICGISLFVKNMLMSSSVFETLLCGSDYKGWYLVTISLSLYQTYLIVNKCAIKLV